MDHLHQSDQQVMNTLAQRAKKKRLRMNMTQKETAEKAGIHTNTLSKFEQGQDVTLLSFIQILRALNELKSLDALLPEPEISPINMLKNKGKTRQRATGTKKTDEETPEW